MPVVSEVIRHIREHVVAESADSDPTQTAGMLERAQLVLDTVQGFTEDNRDIPLDLILSELVAAVPNIRGGNKNSLKRTITNARDSGERAPWLAIHEWVARGRESMDDGFERT